MVTDAREDRQQAVALRLDYVSTRYSGPYGVTKPASRAAVFTVFTPTLNFSRSASIRGAASAAGPAIAASAWAMASSVGCSASGARETSNACAAGQRDLNSR